MRMKKAKHLKPVPIMLDKNAPWYMTSIHLSGLRENAIHQYGGSSRDLEKSIVTDGDLGSLRTLLWAGLIHEDKDLEEETVGSMIVISKLPEIMAAMSKAFKRTAEVGKWK